MNKYIKSIISLLVAVALVSSFQFPPALTDAKQEDGQGEVVQTSPAIPAETVTSETYGTETPAVIQTDNTYKTDRFIIKYKKKNITAKNKSKVKDAKKINNKHFKYGIESVVTKYKISKQELLAEFAADASNIEYIEPDYQVTLSSNDPYYSEQWALVNDSAYGVSANVADAWGQSQGEGVTVAIIDSGIDVNHEDLKDNIWVNKGEIAGDNIDNDGNGYVDDIHGINLVYDNGDVTDTVSHGTHVAGIIGAKKDNVVGIAGVAPKAHLMALKAFDGNAANISDIIQAISYAEENGAKIVNCSFASSYDSQALKEAIQKSSLLFVAAAGNNSSNNDSSPVYPVSYDFDNVISVASISKAGALSSFSNYGRSTVNVAAPGDDIISTTSGNSYTKKSGTSQACAVVSGEASLIMSKYGSLSIAQVKEKIVSTCDQISSLSKKVDGGIINCSNAVGVSDSMVPVNEAVTEEVYQETDPNTVAGDVYQQVMTLQSITGGNNSDGACVISVPAGGINGQLDVNIKGRTEINSLASGSDCEDVSKFRTWEVTLALDSSTKVFGSNAIKMTNPVDGTTVRSCTYNNFRLDNKYYFCSAYLQAGNCQQIEISFSDAYMVSTTSPTMTRVGQKLSPSEASNREFQIRMVTTSSGQYGWFDGLMAVEITAEEFNSLTVDQLMQKYQYVNSVTSSNNIRMKSIGENYVKNGNGENGTQHWKVYGLPDNSNITYNIDCFIIKSNGPTSCIFNELRLVKNKTYTLSVNGRTDGSGTFLVGMSQMGINLLAAVYFQNNETNFVTKTITFTVPNNIDDSTPISVSICLANFSTMSTGYFKEIMLYESYKGISGYESYKESTININQELESLPNGTKDELNTSAGLVNKRTNKDIINGTLNWVMFSSEGGYYKAFAYDWTDYSKVMNDIPGNNIAYNADGKIPYSYIQDSYIVLFVEQSKINMMPSGGTLNGFKEYLNSKPVTLSYQLAQPQTIKLNTPPITCFQNGTVIIDRAIKEIGTYSSGLGISNKAFPIQYIESVYKIDGISRISVDSSKIHIAANNLSLTIDGAVNGEKYEFVYTYDSSLSVLPEIEFTVPTTTDEQIQDNTNMIRQQSELISNLYAELQDLKKQVNQPKRINVGPVPISCTQNTVFDLVLTSSNFDNVSSRKFTVIYNSNELQVDDLYAATPEKETSGNIANISIIENSTGKIVFIINSPVQQGSTWSGGVNTIKFKPLITGQASVSYTAE